jgi:hypothetical protein
VLARERHVTARRTLSYAAIHPCIRVFVRPHTSPRYGGHSGAVFVVFMADHDRSKPSPRMTAWQFFRRWRLYGSPASWGSPVAHGSGSCHLALRRDAHRGLHWASPRPVSRHLRARRDVSLCDMTKSRLFAHCHRSQQPVLWEAPDSESRLGIAIRLPAPLPRCTSRRALEGLDPVQPALPQAYAPSTDPSCMHDAPDGRTALHLA